MPRLQLRIPSALAYAASQVAAGEGRARNDWLIDACTERLGRRDGQLPAKISSLAVIATLGADRESVTLICDDEIVEVIDQFCRKNAIGRAQAVALAMALKLIG
jgi:hypothetical protein